MIKINRAVCPACLQKPDNQFHEQDCNRPDVKRTLFEMQYRKCCYCEKRLSRDDVGCEIEHYMPKNALKDANGNIQWNLANRWENLLIACRDCNSKKGIKLPIINDEITIIDPSKNDIDPEDHIDFEVEEAFFICIKEKKGSNIGQSTIKNLKLKERMDLRISYGQEIIEIDLVFYKLGIALYENDQIGLNRQKNKLSRGMSATSPYAAFRRNYIRKRLRILNEKHIPKLEEQSGHKLQKIMMNFPSGFETRT